MKHFATVLCMACAATAFASAGDAHAVDWTAVGRWTVLVFCAIVLARPLCAGLRALARLAVPALFAFLLLSLGMFATTPNGGTPTREEKERLRAELAAAEAERAALAGILTGGTRSGDATNGAPAFAFTMVGKETNRVELASVWTPEYVFSAIGLYYSRWIESNDWARIDFRTDVSGGTNCAWTITDPTIVTNKAAFFDARGFLADDDSDADGVPAAHEIAIGLDPDLYDSDGDLLSDGEELGSAEVLSGDGFLWIEISGGADNVTHYKDITGTWNYLWILDEYPVSMQGSPCNMFDVYSDGFMIVSRDGESVQPDCGEWMDGWDLRHNARSGGATVVAAVNHSMVPSCPRCIGVVETNGSSYVVYKVEGQQSFMEGVSAPHAVTYEVIVPFDETNTIYVSYLEVDEAVASLAMDLGVQCPSMRSAMNTNELYTIPAPPGALRPRTTVKYVIGRNTDPRIADTDGDGMLDRWELSHGLDPRSASGEDGACGDMDHDGLTNLGECHQGLDPLSFDTDGDGLVDSLDQEPAVYGGALGGQSDAWVAASFTNATGILAEGYTNWVARLGSPDVTNGLFELSVTLPQQCAESVLVNVGGALVISGPGCEVVFAEGKNADIRIRFHPSLMAEPEFCARGFSDLSVTAVSPGSEYVVRLRPELVVSPERIVVVGDVIEGPVTLSAFVDLPVPVEYRWRDVSGPASFGSTDTASTYALGVSKSSLIEVEATAIGYSAVGHVEIVSFDHFSQSGLGASCPSVVFLNDDSDNQNVVPDMTFTERGFDDDELVPVSVRYVGGDPSVASLRLSNPSGSARVRFWSDQRKSELVNRPAAFGASGGTVYLEGVVVSAAEGDVALRAEARTSSGAVVASLDFNVTVCRPVAEPICADKKTIGDDWWVVNPARLVIGERAFFRVSEASGSLPSSRVKWEIVGSGAHIVGSDTGWEVEVAATAAADEVRVVAHFGDCPSAQPTFIVDSCEMRTVKVYPYILRSLKTGDAACSEDFVTRRLAYANKLYRQVGYQFVLGQEISHAGFGDIDVHNFNKDRKGERWQDVLNYHNKVINRGWCDGVELYYCGKIELVDQFGFHHKPLGVTTPQGTFISSESLVCTTAHELGHSLGQKDLYSEIRAVNDNVSVRLSCDVDSGMLADQLDRGRTGHALWSYRPGIKANAIVERCLMLGQVYPGVERVDISSGNIKSFYSVLCNIRADATTEVEVRPVGRHVIDSTFSDKNSRGFWDH